MEPDTYHELTSAYTVQMSTLTTSLEDSTRHTKIHTMILIIDKAFHMAYFRAKLAVEIANAMMPKTGDAIIAS